MESRRLASVAGVRESGGRRCAELFGAHLFSLGAAGGVRGFLRIRGGALGIVAAVAFLLGGCNAPKSNLATFDGYLRSSNLEKCADFAGSKISRSGRPTGEDLLWALQMGSVERLRQNYEESTEYFDRSEEMLNYYDYQNEAVDSFASTLVNENIVPYVGEEYDGVMVNTYKALNFMMVGNDELARVEFNRALDRQRRAKEHFAREIEKVRSEVEAEQGKGDVKRSVENPEVRNLISQRYPGLYQFEAYPDFVNPFATYLAGVYFDMVGDYSKAVDLLKAAYGMVPENPYMAEDLAVTEKILDGQGQLKNTVWVIFENGLGPVKEEFRIDLPLFVATDKVKYVGIALPRLVFREGAYPHLTVQAGGRSYDTRVVAEMDRVVQTEFNKDFGAILTRAIISAAGKAAAQYALQKQDDDKGGAILSIAMAVYSLATTAADVRIWTTLPKDFQVARLSIPADRLIKVGGPGGAPFEVKIPDCKNAIVYVRIPLRQGPQVYDVIRY
ncbi:MAG: hypothetical protein JSU94_05495 [Phycisphaerales bacterium]|nr:MAG: hypothetical protein JSU94_05495 [Phycisphaerales bacterium]